MGVWGSGLYANDSTCDVRNTYLDFLREGLGNIDAYKKTLEKHYEYFGDQDEPLFWFALAETQWKVGRLLPEVKEKALEWINKDGGLSLWEASINGGAGWKKTLNNLRLKLESPMLKEKIIQKSNELDMNLWNVNDVYAYQFHGEDSKKSGYDGKYILLQKIGEGEDYTEGKKMRIQVLDKLFDELPMVNEIDGIRILPLDFPTSTRDLCTNTLMIMYKSKEYPAKYLTFIGNRPGPPNTIQRRHMYNILSWGDIEDWLRKYHDLWIGIEYKTVEEGVYRYT